MKLNFWTKSAADEAIRRLNSYRTYGFIHESPFPYHQVAGTVELYAETMSHAKRMSKRLRDYSDGDIVTAPYKEGGFSVSFTPSGILDPCFRHDFSWSDDETAHALTLFHLLIPLDHIAEYLHRRPVGVLSRIAKFIRIPVLLPSEDPSLDCLIDELDDAIWTDGLDFFAPRFRGKPAESWLDTPFANCSHITPILEAVEKYKVSISEENLVADLIDALQGTKCRDPAHIFFSLLKLFELSIERPEFTTESYLFNRQSFSHFEELYPLYVMARDLSNVAELCFDPPYGSSEGLMVVKEVLGKVLDELAIDEVLGYYNGVPELTSTQESKTRLSEFVSNRKKDALIQAAWCGSEGDVEALLRLAAGGNWYAALIGANLKTTTGASPTQSERSQFRKMCRFPMPTGEDGPISNFRASRTYSDAARRILELLKNEPGPNLLEAI